MADNYYQMTGTLSIKAETPLLKALFAPFSLDTTFPGKGRAYIASDGYASWDDINENLMEELEVRGIEPPEDFDETMEALSRILRDSLGAPYSADFEEFLEHVNFDEEAFIEDVYALATYLDDGHGLSSMTFSGASTCSKPRLFEFGGNATFFGKHFTMHGNSWNVLDVGPVVEAAIEAGDTEKAYTALYTQIDTLLSGIKDAQVAAEIRQNLARSLLE